MTEDVGDFQKASDMAKLAAVLVEEDHGLDAAEAIGVAVERLQPDSSLILGDERFLFNAFCRIAGIKEDIDSYDDWEDRWWNTWRTRRRLLNRLSRDLAKVVV